MIDRGAAFGSAAISVALSMLLAFLFFYTFYLKAYRSGSKGIIAKICLLLGAVSALFIQIGTAKISNELVHSKWIGMSLKEDEIYGGLFLSTIGVIIVSAITWIVKFFDSPASDSPNGSDGSLLSTKSSMEPRISRGNLIVCALTASAIILFALVSNWTGIFGGAISKQKEAQPTESISPPAPTLNQSPSTTMGNNTNAVDSPQVCIFMWVADRGEFIKITSDSMDKNVYTSKLIPKTSSAFYVDDLMRQLRAADAANQDALAREIAKEVMRNSMTIYYDMNLSGAFIHSLAKSRNLESKC